MIAAIPAIAQTAIGAGQFLEGLFMKPGKRPVYEAPQALQDSYRQATSEANATADPMIAAAQNRISQNTANTVNASRKATKSSSQLLNAASQAQVVENAGMNNLAMQNMGMREQRRTRRYQMAGLMGSAQDRAWQVNQMDPYQSRVNAKRALMGAGMQNTIRGLDSYAAAKIQGAPDYQAAVEKEREQMNRHNQAGAFDNPKTYQ